MADVPRNQMKPDDWDLLTDDEIESLARSMTKVVLAAGDTGWCPYCNAFVGASLEHGTGSGRNLQHPWYQCPSEKSRRPRSVYKDLWHTPVQEVADG